MASPLETEIKLAASPAMLEMLRSNPKITGDDRISTLVTTYYDTVARSLWHGGAILRVREADDKREQTLKITPAGGSTVRRHEWNVPITQGAADWSKFPTPANSILTELLGDGRLKAVGTTRIERTTRRVHFGHSIIDVTFDQGTIEASSKILPVSELELELAHGKLVDVVALTLELPLGPDLAWSVRSKAERCRNLAFDLMPSAARGTPIALTSSMNVAEGFAEIAWNCLGHLLANYPLLISTNDPEAVHQCRVAIRRLRAAWSLFGSSVADVVSPILHAQFKAVANELAPARDLHVLLERLETAGANSPTDIGELRDFLGDQRDKAMYAAKEVLATAGFQRLLLATAAWIEAGDWRNREVGHQVNRPLMPFATKLLSRQKRKLRSKAGRLSEMSDIARHRVRIAGKKLRYGSDFFHSLYAGSVAIKQSKTLNKALMSTAVGFQASVAE